MRLNMCTCYLDAHLVAWKEQSWKNLTRGLNSFEWQAVKKVKQRIAEAFKVVFVFINCSTFSYWHKREWTIKVSCRRFYFTAISYDWVYVLCNWYYIHQFSQINHSIIPPFIANSSSPDVEVPSHDCSYTDAAKSFNGNIATVDVSHQYIFMLII